MKMLFVFLFIRTKIILAETGYSKILNIWKLNLY